MNDRFLWYWKWSNNADFLKKTSLDLLHNVWARKIPFDCWTWPGSDSIVEGPNRREAWRGDKGPCNPQSIWMVHLFQVCLLQTQSVNATGGNCEAGERDAGTEDEGSIVWNMSDKKQCGDVCPTPNPTLHRSLPRIATSQIQKDTLRCHLGRTWEKRTTRSKKS